MLPAVTPEHIASFQRDGAVILRNFLSPDEVALLASGIEKVLASPSPLFLVASRDTDRGRFVEDFCNWSRIDEFRRLAWYSQAADAAQVLMQSRTVRLFHDHVLVKEPGTQQETPWHQDLPYYNIEGWMNCSMWAPVDPVAESSTLEFVAGSHRNGWKLPRTFLDEQAKWFPEGSLAEVPPIELEAARGRRELKYPILRWAMEPGDVVFFHMLTLHHSYGVPDMAQRRRVFSLRFVGDDVVHAPRPWKTSPPFEGLAKELPAGVPLDSPLFPLLRPRSLPSSL